MKKLLIKSGAVLLMLVMCLGVLASCDDNKDLSGGTEKVTDGITETVTTENGDQAEADTGTAATGTGRLTIEDLYGDMTEEEIAQFHKDLEDLGMTTDDIIDMLYGE